MGLRMNDFGWPEFSLEKVLSILVTLRVREILLIFTFQLAAFLLKYMKVVVNQA